MAYYNRGLARSVLGDKKAALADLQKASDLFLKQGIRDGYQRATDLIRKLRSSQTLITRRRAEVDSPTKT